MNVKTQTSQEQIDAFIAKGGKVQQIPYGKKSKDLKVKPKPDVTVKAVRKGGEVHEGVERV